MAINGRNKETIAQIAGNLNEVQPLIKEAEELIELGVEAGENLSEQKIRLGELKSRQQSWNRALANRGLV